MVQSTIDKWSNIHIQYYLAYIKKLKTVLLGSKVTLINNP
jgi:hypothetical protein